MIRWSPLQLFADRAMAPRSWHGYPQLRLDFMLLQPRPLCTCTRCDDPLPFSQSVMILRSGFAVRSGITSRSRDHRRHTDAKCRPRPGAIPVPTRKCGGSGKARSVRRATKITSKGFARPDGGRTRKVSSTRSARAPANRAGNPGFDTMVRGVKAQAGIGRQGLYQQGPLRGSLP